jgi:acyl carrier protein
MTELFDLLRQTKPSLTAAPPEDAAWADIGLDSLDLAELAARIEQLYRIEIPDQDWRQLGTVAELRAYLERRRTGHE